MRESEILHEVKKINCDINQKIAYDHDQILRIIFEEDLRDFENVLSDLVNQSGQNADVFFLLIRACFSISINDPELCRQIISSQKFSVTITDLEINTETFRHPRVNINFILTFPLRIKKRPSFLMFNHGVLQKNSLGKRIKFSEKINAVSIKDKKGYNLNNCEILGSFYLCTDKITDRLEAQQTACLKNIYKNSTEKC